MQATYEKNKRSAVINAFTGPPPLCPRSPAATRPGPAPPVGRAVKPEPPPGPRSGGRAPRSPLAREAQPGAVTLDGARRLPEPQNITGF